MGMIDIKKKGLSQDLKELSGDKGFAKRLALSISKIQSEGRTRENTYSQKAKELQKIEKPQQRKVDASVPQVRQKEVTKYKTDYSNPFKFEMIKDYQKRMSGVKKEVLGNASVEAKKQKQLRDINERRTLIETAKRIKEQDRIQRAKNFKIGFNKAMIVGSKVETKLHSALERATQKLGQKLKERVISRRVLKPSQASLTIKEYNAPSVLGDPNRFFRSEMEETKKSLFFS